MGVTPMFKVQTMDTKDVEVRVFQHYFDMDPDEVNSKASLRKTLIALANLADKVITATRNRDEHPENVVFINDCLEASMTFNQANDAFRFFFKSLSKQISEWEKLPTFLDRWLAEEQAEEEHAATAQSAEATEEPVQLADAAA